MKIKLILILSIAGFAIIFPISSLKSNPFGLIGGYQPILPGYAAFVSADGNATSIAVPSLVTLINGVAINSSGLGVIGGTHTVANNPYAALVAPNGNLISLSPLPQFGEIRSVAIAPSGLGLIGGEDNENATPYAALFFGNGTTHRLSSLPSNPGLINSVAINPSGFGLIGGYEYNNAPAYAARVSSNGTVQPLSSLPIDGQINSVAINPSGLGLIGGFDNGLNACYAAQISSDGTVSPLNSLPTNTYISSVAINPSGFGIIGGQYLNDNAFAALVSPNGTVNPLSSLPANGIIYSVAINDSGAGLIGGQDILNNVAYAALVAPNGEVTSLSPLGTNEEILSVAIGPSGNGLIGGGNRLGYPPPYAALVTSNGALIPLSGLPDFATILSVALSILYQIPTNNLSGNNLIFANYINQYSPDTAFYFIPSVLDGTLAKALEKAAPTRNAFALFAADNTLFFLDTILSNHSRKGRHGRQNVNQPELAISKNSFSQFLSADNTEIDREIKGISLQQSKPKLARESQCKNEISSSGNFELWGTVLGALAYQKQEHQAPAFNPQTGTIILGFDGQVSNNARIGLGSAYAHTYIHENEGFGYSHTNQECLFIYGMWNYSDLYFDLAVWGGLFQIDHMRHTAISGFEFTSNSHPKGWQISPHFEIRYDFKSQSNRYIVEPFTMIDWIYNYQKKYEEHGTGPFNSVQKQQGSSFLRSELGMRFYQSFFFERWDLVIQEKTSYLNKKPFDVGKVNAFLVGSPGSFIVETFSTTQNLGAVELDISFIPKNPKYPNGAIQYQGEFGSQYQSHEISLSIYWNF